MCVVLDLLENLTSYHVFFKLKFLGSLEGGIKRKIGILLPHKNTFGEQYRGRYITKFESKDVCRLITL